MNDLDNLPLAKESFAFRDIQGSSAFVSFTVSVSLTVVGTPTYTGRYTVVGRLCFFEVTLVSSTSIATTAGTHYVTLPLTATGLGGVATMGNVTSGIAVGVCQIDVANSRCMLPSQAASAATFSVSGWYEI